MGAWIILILITIMIGSYLLRELIVNAIRTHSIQTLKDNKDEY